MKIKTVIDNIDRRVATWMNYFGHRMLRYSLSIIFIWFGLLKPLGMSPAADLVARTVYWFSPQKFIPILGWWEVAIGACLLIRSTIRIALLLLFVQMPGTALPLLLLPDVCFTRFPIGLTLEGQYIIKNLIIISAAIVIGGTVRHQSSNQHLL